MNGEPIPEFLDKQNPAIGLSIPLQLANIEKHRRHVSLNYIISGKFL